MSRLAELEVAADAKAWAGAGFALDGDECTVGAVRLRFLDPGDSAPGVRGWGLAGEVLGDVDGLTTWAVEDPPVPVAPGAHRLEIVRLDHLVVLTPDLDGTIAAVEAGLGVALKRRRDGPSGSGAPAQQAFFRLGEVILELVKGPDDSAVRFWGLAFEVASLERAVALLGPGRVRTPKPAVQPGRRIASVRDSVGLGLPVALMDTPR